MFVMLAVTFTALIQKTIALVSNIAGGQATFLVDGLQFIVAILLMVLGVLVAFSCLKKLFTAKKQEHKLFVLFSPFPRGNTINVFKCTGKMKLIFVSDSRADICNG